MLTIAITLPATALPFIRLLPRESHAKVIARLAVNGTATTVILVSSARMPNKRLAVLSALGAAFVCSYILTSRNNVKKTRVYLFRYTLIVLHLVFFRKRFSAVLGFHHKKGHLHSSQMESA